MKRLILILLVICATSASALTRQELEAQIRQLVADQKIELDKARIRLSEALSVIDLAQKQVVLVAKERDDWRTYGDDQHDKFMNAEVRVAKSEAALLKRNIVIGALIGAIGVYAFLKFYVRVPFL